jgi:hypothetical protein
MITKENIQSLVGNHVSPYIYNAKKFKPGESTLFTTQVHIGIIKKLKQQWIHS